jgi:hypothetical protein
MNTNHQPTVSKRAEIQEVISSLNLKKLPGYDFFTGKILKELQTIRMTYRAPLLSAVLLKWKQLGISLIKM